MDNHNGILPKGFLIEAKYNVLFFIKKGNNAGTYRIKGKDSKLYFLKLFNFARLNHSAFDSENNWLEIAFLKQIRHENIISYKDSGELIFEGKKFIYLVLHFIAGETLAERISREPFATYYDIKQVIGDALKGLAFLHNLPGPVIHNEVIPQNIILDLSADIPTAKIIGFAYISASIPIENDSICNHLYRPDFLPALRKRPWLYWIYRYRRNKKHFVFAEP